MSVRQRLLFAALGAVAVALIVVVVLVAGRDRSSPRMRTLDVEFQTSAGTVAQLFWADSLHFVEERSTRVPLLPTVEGFQRLRFLVPAQGVRWLRFDPTDAPGDVRIRHMRLLDPNGRVLETFDSENLKPASQIASITQEGDVTRVVTTPGANDPFLFAAFGCLAPRSFRESLLLVTPTTLALAIGAAVLLLTACIVVIGARFGRGPRVGPLQARHTSGWLVAFMMAALFLAVFSAKLLLMRQYPLMVPYWDQWDGEARGLFLPFSECSLSWSQMFYLHNEHRVFFTRLLALGLLVVNNQWDPRLEQVANAAMHALTAVLLVATLWIASERRRLDVLALICGLAFGVPFAWENTLMGFQSAFFFLLLFSILALWLTTKYRAGTVPWSLGWLCAMCGLFTAAGGMLMPLVIVVVAALKLANNRPTWRESLLTIGAAAAVFGIGIVMASPPLPHHEPLRAKTIADFAGALGRNLAWPWIEDPRWGILMWLPMSALLLAVLWRRAQTTLFEQFTIGLGVWVALQAGAIAYGRGAGAPAPAARYQDFLSLGFVANTMALLVGLDHTRSGTLVKRLAAGALACWLLVTVVGFDRLVKGTFIDLTVWGQYWSTGTANVRRFIITGNLAELTSKRSPSQLPYPDAHSLASLLEDPYIRRILPAAVRQPVRVEPREVTNDAFVPEGSYPDTARDPLVRGWGSYSDRGNPAQGRFESKPIASCQLGGHLEFPLAGYLGLPGLRLAVKDLQSGREIEVRPDRFASEEWRSSLVACPPGPYAIVAMDGRPDYWFAFREPVEVGRASPAAESLIAMSPELLVVALGMALLGARWTT